MPEYWLWGRAASALFVLAVASLLLVLVPHAQLALSRYEGWLRGELAFLRAAQSPRALLLAQVGAAGLALLFATLGAWLFTAVLVLGALSVPFVLGRKRRERVALIDRQVEGWLVALANALHATPSLGDALSSSCAVTSAPLVEELELALKEVQLGLGLDAALHAAAERVGSRTFRAAMAVLRTARRTGGNLPRALATSASSLREMARLEGVVRTKTAEGKAQAFVIGAVPVPLYLGIRALDPTFFRPLEATVFGHLVFGGAVVLWGAAVLSARRILKVDI
jgi:tight adherence protein B